MRINLLFLLVILLNSCSANYTPKPRGFFKVSLPIKEYEKSREMLLELGEKKNDTLNQHLEVEISKIETLTTLLSNEKRRFN